MTKEQLKPLQNTGFLPPVENPGKDYIFGGTTGIVHENRLTTGDWRPFLPVGELQRHNRFDDYGCVSHSIENSLEIQGRFLESSTLLRQEDIEWLKYNGYVNKDGNWDFDDRFLVVESGTIPNQGNSMNAPWDTLNRLGVPSQGSVPFDKDMSQAAYYSKSDFPKSAYSLSLKFKERLSVQYERITGISDDILRKVIKHAPIHVALATCGGWFSDDVVHKCVAQANHACLLVHLEENGARWIFDSYSPFLKRLEPGYPLQYAYKGVLSPVINVAGKKKETHIFKKNLKFGDYDNEVVFLAKRLIEEGGLIADNRYIPTPHYGPDISNALRLYQYNSKVTNWFTDLLYRGRYFGTKTREQMNLTLRGSQY